MNTAMLVMIWLTPLMLALPARHRHANWLLPLAPLPALLATAVIPEGTMVSLPWLLLGTTLGMDGAGRVLLGVSSLLWLVVAVYVAGSREAVTDHSRFRIFFLLAMAGNLGLIIAQDMVSFYFGFTLMGLSAYGLIARSTSRRARHAARRYLGWTIAGELLLFMAIIQLATDSGGALTFDALQTIARSPWVVLLLMAGFGIKLALPLLHWWLPAAYVAAPLAAVAVFSGIMIKAGLLGLLRFLPPGEATSPWWGEVLIMIGASAAAFGLIAGLLQRQPRLLLGYSTISKLGILTAGLGAALALPAAAPAITAALLLYAAHHALTKTALFLGLGLVERAGPRPLLLAGLGLLALVMAGAPLTGGALAKSVFGGSLPTNTPVLMTLLSVSTVATTLLMVRFMSLVWTRRQRLAVQLPRIPLGMWLCLLVLIMVLPPALGSMDQLMVNVIPVSLGLLSGAAILLPGFRLPRYLDSRRRQARLQASCGTFQAAAMAGLRCVDTRAHLLHAAGSHVIDASRKRVAHCSAWLNRQAKGARRALTGALWLVIGAWMMASFVPVT